MEGYKTIGQAAECVQVINKSRFISAAWRVENEQSAKAQIAARREEYPDASHHCYAYAVEMAKNQSAFATQRFSDDGEPNGTAGVPILEVIKAKKLSNVLVVVTRYFGGVLLGAAGLLRAYSGGAAAVLDMAGEALILPSCRMWVEVGYGLWEKVKYELQFVEYRVEDVQYGTSVTATLLVRKRDMEMLEQDLARWTNGQAQMILAEELDAAWKT